MKTFLTVAIPTYNRNTNLFQLVSSLLPILVEGTELLIIDNASDIPVVETLKVLISKYDGKGLISNHRNCFNVGMSANIIKCFELSKGEYLWLLGDDDQIDSNALSTITNNIKKYPEAVFFNFNVSGADSRKQTIITSGENFVNSIDRFGPLIFISASVFKRSAFSNNIRYGYIFASTLAPHFALLLVSLKSNDVCILSDQMIADNQKDVSTDTWSYMAGILSFPLLIDCLNKFEDQKVLAQKIVGMLHPLNVAIALLNSSKQQRYRKDFLSYYFGYLHSRVYSLCNLKIRLQWLLLSFSLIFPDFSLYLLSLYKKKRTGNLFLTMKNKYDRV